MNRSPYSWVATMKVAPLARMSAAKPAISGVIEVKTARNAKEEVREVPRD